MAKHRTHSIEFKRKVAQAYLSGETLHALARQHGLSRSLIRVWVSKFETGEFDDDAQAADLLQAYEARIAALERLVGRQAREIEFLKGAVNTDPSPEAPLHPSLQAHRSLGPRRMPTDGPRTLHLL